MNKANDIFLLMINLSQMNHKRKVLRLFLESLNHLLSPITVEFYDQEPGLSNYPINTHNFTYGYIVATPKEIISDEDSSTLHNASKMLAIILERLQYEDNFKQEYTQVEYLADERLIKLKHTVDELQQAKNAYLQLIDELSHEIEQRKVSEKALQETESKNQALLNALPDLMFLFDENGVFLDYHAAKKEELYLAPENFLGKCVGEVMPQHIAQLTEVNIANIKKFGYTSPHVYKLIFNEKVYYFEGRMVPCGKSQFLTIVRNITEEKLTQIELIQFKTAFDTANFGVAISDLNGFLLYVNRYYAHVHGYEIDELIGKSLYLLHNKEQKKLIDDLIIKLLNEGKFDACEVLHCKKDGTIFTMLMAGSLLMDENNTPARLVATAYDITEYKNLEEQFLQSQKLQSVGRLAGGIAHDFNNMLGVIMGYSELMLQKFDKENPFYGSLKEIHTAALRSSALTRQLLTFARKQPVSPKILDLNMVVDDTLKMLSRLIGDNITLEWHPDTQLWPVYLDPAQLDQILFNLCINARDAIDGIGQISINTMNKVVDNSIILTQPDSVLVEYVMLVVSDTGCGMDSDTVSMIYEPFFSTKAMGEGTGLGLSTVYGIVKQNNGFIQVESALGCGTVFKIYFPRYKCITKSEQIFEETVDDIDNRILDKTILLVDDEPALLDSTAKILKNLGYNVLTANSANEALQVFEDSSEIIDLLLTDVIMSDINGYELANILKDKKPNLRYIMMSGYSASAINKNNVLPDEVNFIEKPFRLKELANKLHEVFEGNN